MNNKDNLRPSREELYGLFVTEQRFLAYLALHYGVCQATVKKWIKFYSIPYIQKHRPKKLEVSPRQMRRRAEYSKQ